MKIGMRLGSGAAILAMLLFVLGGMALLQLRHVDRLRKDASKDKWPQLKPTAGGNRVYR